MQVHLFTVDFYFDRLRNHINLISLRLKTKFFASTKIYSSKKEYRIPYQSYRFGIESKRNADILEYIRFHIILFKTSHSY